MGLLSPSWRKKLASDITKEAIVSLAHLAIQYSNDTYMYIILCIY